MPVKVELINTGSELLLGFVLNTHQQWLCRELSARGYSVARQVAVSDAGEMIETAVREALGRADIVITTGGLGPTSDDLTRDRIAQLLGRKLIEDPAVLAHIGGWFGRRQRPMPPRTRVQAMVPEGALVLQNAHGTAPGLVLEVDGFGCGHAASQALLIMLPGPPRELRPMFLNQVVRLLAEKRPPREGVACRVFRTTGLGESIIEERIAAPLADLINSGLDVGYCANIGEVELRLMARGAAAESVVTQAEEIVRRKLGTHIFGINDERLESVVIRLLTERKETLAIAESCTGGYVAHRLTNVSGASAVLLSGVVSYSNDAKKQMLGVREETLAKFGAVSEPTASEMAAGARWISGATFALSITGIAGPAGGTPEKPVGTVFIGLAAPAGTVVEYKLNPYDRETFKFVTAQQALDLLRRQLLGVGSA